MLITFFTSLPLSKGQADSLVNQLRNDWDGSYEAICELIALQMILYIDETGWKVGTRSCYTWVFSSAVHVLFRCGVGRSKDQAQEILGEKFEGIGVSDDYAAYKNLFSEHQLCWAHLLRKAIKLALQYPENSEYGEFLDKLCEVYDQAIGYQQDGRLSVGRAQKVEQLQEQIRELCTRAGEQIEQDTPADQATFIRLQNELVENLHKLFVFVEHPEVNATNNRSERHLRGEAKARKCAQTSQSDKGAERRSVIMTVLASLNTRFEQFTLTNLLEEVSRWLETGCSVFQKELEEYQQTHRPAQPTPVPLE